MLHVLHRTASGRLDNLWEYDPARRIVMLTLKIGAAPPVHVDVPVATARDPRVGSWTLRRLDEHTWEILPSRYGDRRLVPSPIHPSIGSSSVVLVSTPDDVAIEFSLL